MMLERNCRWYLVTAEEPGYFEVSVRVEHCISPLTEDKKANSMAFWCMIPSIT